MNQINKMDHLALLGLAVARLRDKPLPQEVMQCARRRVLDALGCLVAGYHTEVADTIRSYVAAQGGRAEATLLPEGSRTTAALVCLAHATYTFGLELSDAAPRGTVHPGNKVVPAALALAERENSSGADLLAAVVAGYEIETRIGRALFQSAFYRGWWTPGVFGGIGPAMVAGYLCKLDAMALDNTIGIVINLLPTAASRVNDEGASVKSLIGGQACATGILAAEMARRGTKGLRDIATGWLPLLADETYPERLTEGISPDGRFLQWEMLSGILTKFDATVGPLAAALDAIFELLAQHEFTADEVASIHVDCTRRTSTFNTRHPRNEITARASLSYCLAIAVCTRDRSQLMGAGFSREMLTDKTVWATAEKVSVKVNQDYDDRYPAQSLARVTITLKDGRSFSREEDRNARPRYLNPTDQDIEGKFRMIATAVLGQEKTDNVVSLVSRLETLPDIHALVESLKTGARASCR